MNKKIFGITGNISAGKTYLAKTMQEVFNDLGLEFNIIDVDDVRRRILYVSTKPAHKKIRKIIAKEFNILVDNDKCFFDRKELSNIIFAKINNIEKFNIIINIEIKKEIKRDILKLKGYIAIEWARLIEDDFLGLVKNNVLILKCNRKVQVERILKNIDLPLSQMKKRINFQTSLGKKLKILKKKELGHGMVKIFDTSSNPRRDKYNNLVGEIINEIDDKKRKK